MMIKIGICDDEKIILGEVKRIVDLYYKEKNIIDYKIKLFLSGNMLIKEDEEFDILFLDIEMPGLDGIDVGKKLLSRENKGKIIIITSKVERFREAFEIEAYRFITKPIDKIQVYNALDDISKYYRKRKLVEIEKNGLKFKIKSDDISYLESYDGLTEIYLKKQIFKSNKSLTRWEEELDKEVFFRCHKKYIVNLGKIEKYDDEIILNTGEKILCSRRNKKELKNKLIQYDLNS